MEKVHFLFGLKGFFKNYGWKGFLIDSCIPSCLSTLLCCMAYGRGSDILLQLRHLTGIGVSTVPVMFALSLIVHCIMLLIFGSDRLMPLKETKDGRKLMVLLNSTFAACSFVSLFSALMMFSVSCIANMCITVPCSAGYALYFLTCFMLSYSITVFVGIVTDVFNIGQTILLEILGKSK